MLLSPQKSKLATLIVSKAKPESFKEAGEVAENPKSDDTVALEAAARKMIDAMKADDAASLVGALKSIFMILESEDDAMEGEE